MHRHKPRQLGAFFSILLLLSVFMAQTVFAGSSSYSFEKGFPEGWKKHQDQYVMTVDEKEKALKIDASSGSKLEFEPAGAFPIGENKNRYMVLRIKGDPDMTRVVVYFTLMSQGENHPYGSTVRLIENQKIGEDTYTDIIFDLYEKGKGYGNDWNGELRRLRLDLNNAQGKDPSGTLYLQSIIFYDTKGEISSGVEQPPVTVAPTTTAPTAPPTKPTETPETESNPVENSSPAIQTTKKAADTKTTSVKKTEKPVISDGDGSGPNILLIVLVSLAVVIAAAGIVSAFLLAKKMNLSTGPSDGPGASK